MRWLLKNKFTMWPRTLIESVAHYNLSNIEVIASYLRSGRIKVDSTIIQQPVTLHDPGNLVR